MNAQNVVLLKAVLFTPETVRFALGEVVPMPTLPVLADIANLVVPSPLSILKSLFATPFQFGSPTAQSFDVPVWKYTAEETDVFDRLISWFAAFCPWIKRVASPDVD